MRHQDIFSILLDWGVQAELVLGAAERWGMSSKGMCGGVW